MVGQTMKPGVKPRSRLSKPPYLWRNCGWPTHPKAGDRFAVVLSNKDGTEYVYSLVAHIAVIRQIDDKTGEIDTYYLVHDDSGTWPVDPSRCFENPLEAQEECLNLNQWLSSRRTQESGE